MDAASFHIGDLVTVQDLGQYFNGKYMEFDRGKILLPDFIPFQYGNLSPKAPPHRPIIKLVEKHGLILDGDRYIKETNGQLFGAIGKIHKQFNSEKKPKPVLDPAELWEQIVTDQQFIEPLTMHDKSATLETLTESFYECFAYHKDKPNPPEEVYEWKSKFVTWCTIKKQNKKNGKATTKERTADLIGSFEKRHARKADG